MSVPTLREALADWTDADQAAFKLGVCLGLWTEAEWPANKYRFWTRDELGACLMHILSRLFKDDVLELDEADRYRWREENRG